MVVLGQRIPDGGMAIVTDVGHSSNLVVVDFSGTLSLGSVLFGREESLQKALRSSHLYELGIDQPDIFWNELVHPTWEEGSTTSQGYSALLAARVQHRLQAQHREVAERYVKRSASRFVRLYLRASRIHTVWREVLQYLLSVPSVRVVIATDHYAEATAHIEAQLRRLGVVEEEERVLIANSADIGARKESAAYWEQVRARLPVPPSEVILIDDFGANEHALDAYAEASAVARRREATAVTLQQVFHVPVIVFEFVLASEQIGSLQKLRWAYRRKVREVDAFLRRRLGGVDAPRG